MTQITRPSRMMSKSVCDCARKNTYITATAQKAFLWSVALRLTTVFVQRTVLFCASSPRTIGSVNFGITNVPVKKVYHQIAERSHKCVCVLKHPSQCRATGCHKCACHNDAKSCRRTRHVCPCGCGKHLKTPCMCTGEDECKASVHVKAPCFTYIVAMCPRLSIGTAKLVSMYAATYTKRK